MSLRGVAGFGKPDTQCVTSATTSNLPIFYHLADSQQYNEDSSSLSLRRNDNFKINNYLLCRGAKKEEPKIGSKLLTK